MFFCFQNGLQHIWIMALLVVRKNPTFSYDEKEPSFLLSCTNRKCYKSLPIIFFFKNLVYSWRTRNNKTFKKFFQCYRNHEKKFESSPINAVIYKLANNFLIRFFNCQKILKLLRFSMSCFQTLSVKEQALINIKAVLFGNIYVVLN